MLPKHGEGERVLWRKVFELLESVIDPGVDLAGII